MLLTVGAGRRSRYSVSSSLILAPHAHPTQCLWVLFGTVLMNSVSFGASAVVQR